MFSRCSSLNHINISSFKTKKTKYMISMFENCSTLKFLNLSNFSVDCLISMDFMISNCNSLETFIPPTFSNQQNDISMKHMIEQCNSLKKIEINSLLKKKLMLIICLKDAIQ